MPLTALSPSQHLIDLVGTLGGSWHGRTAMCQCPAHSDRTPSLSLRQGDRGILVTCFAGCEREEVLRALRTVSVTGTFAAPATANPRPGGFERLWDGGAPIEGTLAERYLGGRWLLPAPGDVRFHSSCPYRPQPWTTYHPALLVAVRQLGKLVAVQRIYLDPATAACKRKLMLGQPWAGAWQGGGQGGSVLALAEGFETARAFTILQGTPCWASLGARRLHQILIPDYVTELILAADNDDEGARAVERASAELARPGLTITPEFPNLRGDDWADVLDREVRAAAA